MPLSERSRSRTALGVAAALHALLFVTVREAGRAATRPLDAPQALTDTTLFDVEAIADETAPPAPSLDERMASLSEPARDLEQRMARGTPRVHANPESELAPRAELGAIAPSEPSGNATPDTEGSGAEPSARAAAPGTNLGARPSLSLEQLGVGEHNPFLADAARTIGDKPAAGEGIRHSLEQAIVKSDRERNLGPEGPVITLLEAQTRATDGIMNANALFRVMADGHGHVLGVEVLESSSGGPAWKKVAQDLLAALRSVTLRVPHGLRGVTLDVRVTSRVQLPSGADPGMGVDVLGIPLKKPGGEHSPRISILGFEPQGYVVELPNGKVLKLPLLHLDKLLAVSGDLADLSGKAQRLVHAHLEHLTANETGGE